MDLFEFTMCGSSNRLRRHRDCFVETLLLVPNLQYIQRIFVNLQEKKIFTMGKIMSVL